MLFKQIKNSVEKLLISFKCILGYARNPGITIQTTDKHAIFKSNGGGDATNGIVPIMYNTEKYCTTVASPGDIILSPTLTSRKAVDDKCAKINKINTATADFGELYFENIAAYSEIYTDDAIPQMIICPSVSILFLSRMKFIGEIE